MARHEKIRGRNCKRLKIVSKLSDAAVTAPFDDQLSQNAQTLQPQNPYLCLVHEIDDLHENSSLSYMSCYYFAVVK